MTGTPRYRHLNHEGRWRDFRHWGLALHDGALRLRGLPRAVASPEDSPRSLGTAAGPGGLVVTPEGIYYSDPAGRRVWRIERCFGGLAPVPCLGGGDAPGALGKPRGLAYDRERHVLAIADAEAGRVLLVDPRTGQLAALWNVATLADGDDCAAPSEPVALAFGNDGTLYVVDRGRRRLIAIERRGRLRSSFQRNVGTPRWEGEVIALENPVAIAVGPDGAELFVLDAGSPPRVLAFDQAGHRTRQAIELPSITAPMGLAVTEDALYVGDADRILKVDLGDHAVVGNAVGHRAPVAALALDRQGSLLAHAGSGPAPVALELDAAYATTGLLWGGPFRNPSGRSEQWHRLRATVDGQTDGARIELLTFSTQSDRPPAAPDGGSWTAAPPGAAEILIPGKPYDHVWVAARLSGDGRSTPTLRQLRLDFDHDGYERHLPAVYRRDAATRDHLHRLLAVFESGFDTVEAAIRRLPALFDVDAAPSAARPWLAETVGTSFDERWPDPTARDVIAHAIARHGRRGTVPGIREIIQVLTGIEVRIEEPILQANWWSLASANDTDEGEDSRLGVSTVLVAAHPQGAVMGTSAVLDRSHLTNASGFGEPLFDDIAHRFVVRVAASQLRCEADESALRAVVEREKPAHTAYHLCIVRPGLRVGGKARLGIDAIIGSPESSPTRLGEADAAGLVLAGELAGRVSAQSVIGSTTRLGGSSPESSPPCPPTSSR